VTRHWHLRTWLIWLLCVSSLVTSVAIGAVLAFVRLPQISAETRADLAHEAADLSRRTEVILATLKGQLDLLAVVAAGLPEADARAAMGRMAGEGGPFVAVYQVDAGDTVVRAVVGREAGAGRGAELVGNDLSRDPLLQRVRARGETTWSDKYISPVSGMTTVGVGVPVGRHVLIGELPLAFVLKTVRDLSGRTARTVTVLDRRGEVLADSEQPVRVGTLNLGADPLFLAAREGGEPVGEFALDGQTFDAALAHSQALDWYFLVRTPGGLANPRVGSTFDLGVAALAGSLILGILLAPLWATGVLRPVKAIIERARRVADGEAPGEWPRGRSIELNALSSDLERMAGVLQAREQELQAIFDASPVGIGVLDPAADYAFVKANEAVSQLLAVPPAQLIGRSGTDLGLWAEGAARHAFYARLAVDGAAETEAWLNRGRGGQFLAAIVTRNVTIAGQPRTIWVVRDVTELRRIEAELRDLNTELEARVARRTDQLRQANVDLSETLERLQLTLGELVRAEKLASLGALVAGIAHELNTPLGNGVMAVSSLRGALTAFRRESEQGLRRSSLEQLLEAVDTGTDIAGRNLARAAELVASFKQVAADQTSSQRRSFELAELTAEIALTLKPLLKRGHASIVTEVPPDLSLDSYPGPLGQVLTNLVANAVTHAFGERTDGRIRVVAMPGREGRVTIQVGDDGAGIDPGLLPRIFDPFVTSRMGRGGTGLGLHIAHNLVVQVLGGSISVESTLGGGTTFTLDLPRVAPVAKSA
jgi:PAS domain S-box-containing protein